METIPNWILADTKDGITAFRPGDAVEGRVWWQLDREPTSVEVSLLWHTEGKGDRDVGVVETLSYADPQREERRQFRFRLPEGPYSFSGRLVSLVWAVEAVAQPGDVTARVEITVSPTGAELQLHGPDSPPEA